MKTISDQQLTKYAIPDGEGLTALPISFYLNPYPLLSPIGRGAS